jgi:cell division protein FtsA
MFGIGGRAFTRAIERDLGVEFDQAEKLKLALAQQTLPDKQAQAVTIALSQVLDVWVGGVELALGEFTALDHLPHRLYLCGGGASLQLLVERLHDSDWYTRLPFTRKPTIEHIHPDQVVGIVDQSGKVTDHTYVTAMGLLRVGLDTVQSTGVGEADTVKQKIDRILHV